MTSSTRESPEPWEGLIVCDHRTASPLQKAGAKGHAFNHYHYLSRSGLRHARLGPVFRAQQSPVQETHPFSRASRVEFQAGVSRISFDQITRTQAFSLITGQQLIDDRHDESIASPLTLAARLARRCSKHPRFGATSPVAGQRYRLEVAPTFGTINFTSALVDYRRYFMPVPFYTIAVRVMHYGRYGSGGEDARLVPLYIGYPDLVRGYDVNSFDARGCVPTAMQKLVNWWVGELAN